MALILIEQEQAIEIVGLYELENELVQMNYSINILQDLLEPVTKNFTCSQGSVQVEMVEDVRQLAQALSDQFARLLSRLNITIQRPEEEFGLEVILDDMIRPALEAHEGNIKVTYQTDNVMGFELLGACQGCPFSLLTLTSHIARIIGMYFPQVYILHIE